MIFYEPFNLYNNLSKPSGRAEMWKCQSPQLYNKGKGRGVSHGCLAVFVIMLMGSISLTLTSCGADKQRYHFSTAQEGINRYREFYKEMRNASDDKMTAIAKDITTWQELEDSVMAVILRDTVAAGIPISIPTKLYATCMPQYVRSFSTAPLPGHVTCRMCWP